MKIRNIVESDFENINNIYKEAGFSYEMPDLNRPLFIVKQAVEDDFGNVIGYGVVKLQCEAYLFLDQKYTPKTKIEAMDILNDSVSLACWGKGLDQISSWIPPEIEERFSKRMKKMGWIKSPWPNYTKNLLE